MHAVLFILQAVCVHTILHNILYNMYVVPQCWFCRVPCVCAISRKYVYTPYFGLIMCI